MERPRIQPIAAFDVEDGRAKPVENDWPGLSVAAGYRWLHLDVKDPATTRWVHNHMPGIAGRALLQNETRPRCERLLDGLMLNLRGVNLNPGSDPEDMVSLRLWVTGTVIVSARVRRVWSVDALKQTAENGTAPATVGRFLAELTHDLTNRIERVSLDLEEQTDTLEEAVSEARTLPAGEIGSLRQAVIKMRRFINPQRDAIATLATLENWILTPDELALLRETSNRTRRIVEELDAARDRLSALQEHLDADRAHRLGRNSYILSVVAAIFLPLGFLTGLFGVNVAGMPGTTDPIAFSVLTAVSVVAGIALYLIFKFARWL